MKDYLNKKLEQLIESVLEPIWERIINSSWKIRLLILVGICGAGAAYTYPELSTNLARDTVSVSRIIFANNDTIPIARGIIQKAINIKNRLTLSIRNDLDQFDTGRITPWTVAQLAEAIGRTHDSDRYGPKISKFIRDHKPHGCDCWTVLLEEEPRKAWIFISGWVFSAFADYKTAATPSEIRFLLEHQNRDGSWPALPQKDVPQIASTYATAWAIIGLHKQRVASLIEGEQTKIVGTAIERGATWLLSVRQEGARWKSYPNIPSDSTSDSISGLVLHALHYSIPEHVEELDREWLESIPRSPIPASKDEKSFVELFVNGELYYDFFTQLTMPWMLVGTVDAFKNGTLFQKATALSWIERTVSHKSVFNADAEQDNWWQAEILISINHLLSHSKAPRK